MAPPLAIPMMHYNKSAAQEVSTKSPLHMLPAVFPNTSIILHALSVSSRSIQPAGNQREKQSDNSYPYKVWRANQQSHNANNGQHSHNAKIQIFQKSMPFGTTSGKQKSWCHQRKGRKCKETNTDNKYYL